MRVSSFSIRVSTSFAFLGMLLSDVWKVVGIVRRFIDRSVTFERVFPGWDCETSSLKVAAVNQRAGD